MTANTSTEMPRPDQTMMLFKIVLTILSVAIAGLFGYLSLIQSQINSQGRELAANSREQRIIREEQLAVQALNQDQSQQIAAFQVEIAERIAEVERALLEAIVNSTRDRFTGTEGNVLSQSVSDIRADMGDRFRALDAGLARLLVQYESQNRLLLEIEERLDQHERAFEVHGNGPSAPSAPR